MPEFVNQDSYDGGSAHKYNCALKPLSILTFLPTSLSTCLKWKIKKKTFKELNETKNKFSSPQMSSSWFYRLN